MNIDILAAVSVELTDRVSEANGKIKAIEDALAGRALSRFDYLGEFGVERCKENAQRLTLAYCAGAEWRPLIGAPVETKLAFAKIADSFVDAYVDAAKRMLAGQTE